MSGGLWVSVGLLSTTALEHPCGLISRPPSGAHPHTVSWERCAVAAVSGGRWFLSVLSLEIPLFPRDWFFFLKSQSKKSPHPNAAPSMRTPAHVPSREPRGTLAYQVSRLTKMGGAILYVKLFPMARDVRLGSHGSPGTYTVAPETGPIRFGTF
jgi:hypothetical protein